MTSLIRTFSATVAALLCVSSLSHGVEIAKEFKLTDRNSGKPIKLTDYAGKILFIDFFAYWCPPCQTSSPVVETDIADYYTKRNGNPHGIKVEVLGVNVELSNADQTDAFIESAGLKHVADDPMTSSGAWAQFGAGGIPHFVVINCAKSKTHQEWEILHSASGFRGASYYRDLIDSIEPSATKKKPKIAVQLPNGRSLKDGGTTSNYGSNKVRSTPVTKTFMIENKGTANLKALNVVISGENRKDFQTVKLIKTTLAPGEKTRLTVGFKPTAKGRRQAIMKIRSKYPNENLFDIKLIGTGT